MSWFTDLFSSKAGGFVESIGNVVDKFHLSGEEKQQFKIQLQTLVAARDSEIEQTVRKNLEAKERILVAELNQGDSYTKRARPTVVYFGLLMIFINYLVVPLVALIAGQQPEAFPLPTEFWAAWGGIVSTWAVGRSFEKLGTKNKAVQSVTGTKPLSLLD